MRLTRPQMLIVLAFAVAIASACQTAMTPGEDPAAATTMAARDSSGTPATDVAAPADEMEAAKPQISFGNGEANWIVTDGMTRKGDMLQFTEVQIDGNGWLVLHPFKDGRPVGEIYVGSSYLKNGINRNVDIYVERGIETGDMFLVMLHSDVNDNKEFDFVFVDERNVLDKAVFEGMTMIAHPVVAP